MLRNQLMDSVVCRRDRLPTQPPHYTYSSPAAGQQQQQGKEKCKGKEKVVPSSGKKEKKAPKRTKLGRRRPSRPPPKMEIIRGTAKDKVKVKKMKIYIL
jgi:hypothetical protein